MYGLRLRPELFLYLYMASCIAVLIFNIAYIFIDRYQQKNMRKKSLDMVETIRGQMDEVEAGRKVSKEHIILMEADLKKIKRMKAFERTMDEIQTQTSQTACDQYLKQIRIVFIRLIPVYEKRDAIEKAYFARIIEKFRIDRGRETFDPLMEFLVQLTINKDVFVRENALRAVFSMGNKEAVLSAWEKMEDNYVWHNEKLLSEGLLQYTGDKEELISLLLKRCESFEVNLVLPILQFIRYYSGSFQEECRKILQKETNHKELRLEALRYFRKYPYEPMREDIKKYVRYQEYVDWEYAAIAAQTLGSYPGLDTVKCLKEGLKSTNWYVRLNCAESLIVSMKIPQLELFDVYNGADRYAREILQYVTEKSEMKEQEMELRGSFV